jgi:tetratricopeptide (TPR) repeat protein
MSELAQERIKSLEQRLTLEPQSPLFARLASHYLQVGRVKDALRLCDDGLAHYPFYTTAHLIKGKALAELGMMAEAKHEYEVVHEFLPTNETIARLASSVDLGTSQHPQAPPLVQKDAEAEAPAVAMPKGALEEPIVEEEVQQALVEDAPPQEPQTFEPTEISRPAEDSLGFEEQPVVEPQPEESGAAEKLGLAMQIEPQQTFSDFNFDAAEQERPSADTEETPFGSQPMEEPQRAIEPEPEQPQERSPFESPMMEAVQANPEPAVPAASEISGEETPDWFEAFSQLQQPAEVTAETPADSPSEEENPFAMFGGDQSSATVEGEPYEEFTARVGMELSGTENTVTLEEYLGQAGSAQPSPEPADNIGELAEKLKTSPRITPPVINFAEKSSRSASEADSASGSGFVTPTLAEIYVKQGWFDDAIKAYRALATNKPAEREKFEQRIAEIEGMKK